MALRPSRLPEPRLPPPLPDWPYHEGSILEEISDAAIALEVWLHARHLRDWVESETTQRGALFHVPTRTSVLERRAEIRAHAPDLAVVLAPFEQLTDSSPPDDAQLADACVMAAKWASEQRFTRTALFFSTAGTRLGAGSARYANVAGLMHRLASDWPRAEVYYERAIIQARNQKNPVEYIGGHLGAAALWYARGRLDRTYAHLRTATNAAHRSGREWLAGHAQHDLMLILTDNEEFGAAEAAAARAVHLYPLHDKRLPFLAADYAYLQIAQQRYSDAIPLLEKFLSVLEHPAQAVIGMSMLARAFAGIGRRQQYERMQDRVIELTDVYTQDAAAALYHLAEGARACAAWETAERFVQRAQQLAIDCGNRWVARLSAALSDEIDARRFAFRPAEPDCEAARLATINLLATRLSKWHAKNRRGRRRTGDGDQWVAA